MDANKVEIFGRYYTIKGMQNQEYLETLARFVDSHMKNIVSTTGTVDTLKVAILAALTIADVHFKSEQNQIEADKKFERNIDALSDQIRLAQTG